MSFWWNGDLYNTNPRDDDGDGWVAPTVDAREMIGGPLDGCLYRELHPATNVGHYYQPWQGKDFFYIPPLVYADEMPKESPAMYYARWLLLGGLLGTYIYFVS